MLSKGIWNSRVKKPSWSSIVNVVILEILDFFIQTFHKHKKHETLTTTTKKQMLLKNI